MGEAFSIFILKSKPDSLRQAEAFLKNRNWIVGSGTHLREALVYIAQKKPEFVLIAADHPNKKVKILPELLTQAFSVKPISFAESQARASIASLHEMSLEYSLFPPVSGPAIERIILKMKRDEEKRAKEPDDRKKQEGKSNSANDIIQLKGEISSGGDTTLSFEQARAALNQLISTDSDEASSPDAIVAKGEGSTPGIAYMGGSTGDTAPSGYGEQNEETNSPFEARKSKEGVGFDFGSPGSPSSPVERGPAGYGSMAGPNLDGFPEEGPREGESYGDWEARMREALAAYQNKENSPFANPQQKANDFSSDPTFQTGTPFQGSHSENEPSSKGQRKGEAPIMEHDPIGSKKRLTPRYKRDPGLDDPNASIFVKGTQQALNESVIVREGLTSYEEIERSSHCACIIVESERFSGYLVAALGKNRKIDTTFMNLIKQRLFAFLKAHGEIVKESDTMNIKIEEVEFEDWAMEQADFLRKSIHDGDEIAMAFFPTKETSVKLEESVSEKMLQLDISELKEDTAVEFDLYIYMPENNKYLLYTPQGRPLYGQQKSRLAEKGITHMHLRKESAHNVKKYRAQNYLNDKIAAYKTAQKIKKV
jgi:hypothetical protein